MRLLRQDWVVLVALTALAAALRLYQLNAPLWYDEILTLVDYVRLPLGQIVSTYESLNNHILFSLQSHLSVAAFGESPWAVRLPAALFGIATVPLLWVIVRYAGASRVFAAVAAALLALNYHHIWFSQNARGYTGLVFWCLLSMLLVSVGRRNGSKAAWAGVAIAGALAVYTHLSAAFFLFALFLAGLFAEWGELDRDGRKKRVIALFVSFSGMAVLILALYLPLIGDIFSTLGEVTDPVEAEQTVNTLEKWKSPLTALLSALDDLPGPLIAALVAIPVALIVLGAGWLSLKRDDPLIAWTIPLSIVVTVGLLLVAGMRIWPRFFLADVVLFLVLATYGVPAISNLVMRGAGAKPVCWAGWALGIAVSAVWGAQNFTAPKQDFAGGVAFAETHAQPGDAFATFGLSVLPVVDFYRPNWLALEDPQDLDKALDAVRGQGALWVVFGFKDHSREKQPVIYDRIENGFERREKLKGTLGGGYVYVYRSTEAANAKE